MKTEFIDVSQTRKNLVVEIPSTTVDAEIDRITHDYSRAARIPGFRPGKVPARLVRQRFRDQILHDVAHGLIPRAVDDALRERGVEPVDTPDIRDVVVEEGKPLKFTASFETVPPIDPGDYEALSLRRPEPAVDAAEVDRRLSLLQERAARYEAVEERALEAGDTAIVDLVRRPVAPETGKKGAAAQSNRHDDIAVDIGSPANPPGFDEELIGLTPGASKTFTVTYPADHAIRELAGTEVEYSVALKTIRRRVVPALDDELAKDLGQFESLSELRANIEEEVRAAAERTADREVRSNLLEQLARRVTIDVPEALVAREVDRRLEEFVRRLLDQQIDPTRTNINWEEFRQRQQEPAIEAVRGALVLDEVARREGLAVTDEELEAEIGRYAERSGRTASAVRAGLEKEGGIIRLYTGLRREKVIDFLLARATIVPV